MCQVYGLHAQTLLTVDNVIIPSPVHIKQPHSMVPMLSLCVNPLDLPW